MSNYNKDININNVSLFSSNVSDIEATKEHAIANETNRKTISNTLDALLSTQLKKEQVIKERQDQEEREAKREKKEKDREEKRVKREKEKKEQDEKREKKRQEREIRIEKQRKEQEINREKRKKEQEFKIAEKLKKDKDSREAKTSFLNFQLEANNIIGDFGRLDLQKQNSQIVFNEYNSKLKKNHENAKKSLTNDEQRFLYHNLSALSLNKDQNKIAQLSFLAGKKIDQSNNKKFLAQSYYDFTDSIRNNNPSSEEIKESIQTLKLLEDKKASGEKKDIYSNTYKLDQNNRINTMLSDAFYYQIDNNNSNQAVNIFASLKDQLPNIEKERMIDALKESSIINKASKNYKDISTKEIDSKDFVGNFGSPESINKESINEALSNIEDEKVRDKTKELLVERIKFLKSERDKEHSNLVVNVTDRVLRNGESFNDLLASEQRRLTDVEKNQLKMGENRETNQSILLRFNENPSTINKENLKKYEIYLSSLDYKKLYDRSKAIENPKFLAPMQVLKKTLSNVANDSFGKLPNREDLKKKKDKLKYLQAVRDRNNLYDFYLPFAYDFISQQGRSPTKKEIIDFLESNNTANNPFLSIKKQVK